MSTLFDPPFNMAGSDKELRAVAITLWLFTTKQNQKEDPVWDKAELEVLTLLMLDEAARARAEGRPRLMKQIEKQLEQGPGAFEGLLKSTPGWDNANAGFREMVFQGLLTKLKPVCNMPDFEFLEANLKV